MEAIADLYRRAARCRVCFVDKTGLKAPIIDVAQPRWVGTRYRDARPRIVFLMLNPGAGDPSKEAGNRAARQVLLGFRDGGATFAEVLGLGNQPGRKPNPVLCLGVAPKSPIAPYRPEGSYVFGRCGNWVSAKFNWRGC